ncbi:MAG: magnesium/cobalt transporter CorA [Spirochaetes bacterium]|nr:MAG: magnesium/cobalt transporter CorA [Spirochaetota bacterium]
MKKLVNRVSKKKGLPPGSLVHVGEKKTEEVRVLLVEYNEQKFNIKDIGEISACCDSAFENSIRWIDVVGIHKVDLIGELGKTFGIHPLVLEDILNTNQRPKFDVWEDYTYVVLKILHFDEKSGEIVPEQVSIILGRDLVITFQETAGDDFIPVIDRIMNDQGRIRKQGADFLFYALLDAIVDNYFSIFEKLGEKIEAIEEEVIGHPDRDTINDIHFMKREMILLRRSVWPLREVVSGLGRGESPMISQANLVYFKDIYDHTIQIIDTIEVFRDMLSGMVDIYLSSLNIRMNEIMKVLTIITTIFIPLSFITGVYGMNFKFMPGLENPYAYFIAMGVMILIGLGMLAIFKKRKWF